MNLQNANFMTGEMFHLVMKSRSNSVFVVYGIRNAATMLDYIVTDRTHLNDWCDARRLFSHGEVILGPFVMLGTTTQRGTDIIVIERGGTVLSIGLGVCIYSTHGKGGSIRGATYASRLT